RASAIHLGCALSAASESSRGEPEDTGRSFIIVKAGNSTVLRASFSVQAGSACISNRRSRAAYRRSASGKHEHYDSPQSRPSSSGVRLAILTFAIALCRARCCKTLVAVVSAAWTMAYAHQPSAISPLSPLAPVSVRSLGRFEWQRGSELQL